MLWWILGAVGSICVLFVLIVVVVAIVVSIRTVGHRRKVAEAGVPVTGWIVQANSNLYGNHLDTDSAAQILITFDRQLSQDEPRMQELVRRFARLKSEPPSDDVERQLAPHVIDETTRLSSRFKLPPEFTGGPEVFSVDVMVRRKFLPTGKLTLPYIQCRALPGNEGGEVLMTEYSRS